MSYVTSRSKAPWRRRIPARAGATFLALVLAAGLPACDALNPDELLSANGNKNRPGGASATSLKPVSISPQEEVINAVGHTRQLQATVLNPAGKPRENASVTWRSLDPEVATVDSNGTVTAVAAGLALITAASGGEIDTARVHVRQIVAAVEMDPAQTNAPAGSTVQLTAVAADSNDVAIPEAAFVWSSSSPEVAEVDAAGLVTTKKEGTAEIVVQARLGSAKAKGQVQVGGGTPPPPPPPPASAPGDLFPTNSLRFTDANYALAIEEMRVPRVLDESGREVKADFFASFGSSPAKSTRIINVGGSNNSYIRGKRQGWSMVIARDRANNRIGYRIYGVDMPSPQITSGFAPVSCGTDCYAPPASIDQSGGKSVTWELLRFFDQVPDGTPGRPVTVRLPAGARFRSDASLILLNRKYLRIEGQGARIFQTESGAGAYRLLLHLYLGVDIEVRDLVLQGSNPNTGAIPKVWNSAREFEGGLRIEGVQGVRIHNVEVRETWGDGFWLRSENLWSGQTVRDVLLTNNRIHTIGRQGITIGGVEHAVIGGSPQQANYVGNIQRSIIDIEPIGWGQPTRHIEISHNKIGPANNRFVANLGHHAPTEFINILYNQLEGQAMTIQSRPPSPERRTSNPNYRRNNWRIIGNVSDKSESYHVIRLDEVDHFEVRGNTQMIAATSGDRCFVLSNLSGGRKVVAENAVTRHGKIVPEYTVETWCDTTMELIEDLQ